MELAAELRFAPRGAVVRDIARAEGLAAEIDESLQYPADWVVYRVTGYRPEMDEPSLLPGGALLGDLSSLVERLCDAAGLRLGDIEGNFESADGLADRWGVSRKTLSRWRRRGLIGRRVHETDGSTRLVFTAASVAAFEGRRGEVLARAAGYSRLGPAVEARMIERARRYREAAGLTTTQITERLAQRYGRSREAVRQVLLRHDEAAQALGEPRLLDRPRVLDARAQRVIERAWRRGIEPGVMVGRYGRTRGGIHRIINEQRLRRLAGLGLGHTAPRAGSLDAAEVEAVLGAAAVGSLGPAPAPADMTELVAMMRERVVPVGVEERAPARAAHGLRARAAGLIVAMRRDGPEAGLIDRAETDLRWAASLRTALARTQLHLVLETLESTLGADLGHMRSQDARGVVEAGLAGLRAGLDAYDPWKSGRLAAPVGLMVARVQLGLPRRGAPGERPRAQVRMLVGTPAPDWAVLVSPWVAGLLPDRRLSGARPAMDADLAALLGERFGLDGARPRTLAEVAEARGVTIMQAGRLERRALRAGLAAARG